MDVTQTTKVSLLVHNYGRSILYSPPLLSFEQTLVPYKSDKTATFCKFGSPSLFCGSKRAFFSSNFEKEKKVQSNFPLCLYNCSYFTRKNLQHVTFNCRKSKRPHGRVATYSVTFLEKLFSLHQFLVFGTWFISSGFGRNFYLFACSFSER